MKALTQTLCAALLLLAQGALAATGQVTITPATQTVEPGTAFSVDIVADAGGDAVAAYELLLSFDPARVQVDAAVGTDGVSAGSDAVTVWNIVNLDNAAGTLKLAGFHISGAAPSGMAHLLSVAFVAADAEGNTTLGLTVEELKNPDRQPIGTPTGTGAMLSIEERRELALEIALAAISENGAVVSATLTRNGSVSAPLSVALTSSDSTEATVPASLNIPAGAQSASFDITAIDDNLVDGPQLVTISVAADGYDGAAASITITDDDRAGVTATPSGGLSTGEDGAAASFTLVLDSEPVADVTLALTSSNADEGTVAPAGLTFTAGNWSTPRTVTVTGVDDDLDDGDQAYQVQLAVTSGDANYQALTPPTVAVTNLDNDEPSRTLSLSFAGDGAGGVQLDPPGDTCTATCSRDYEQGSEVSLTAQPDADMAFDGWSGACVGTDPVCTLMLDADASVSASFSEIDQRMQRVYSNAVQPIQVPEGRGFLLPLLYDVIDGNTALTGLGLRIHYDSSVLAWQGNQNVLAASLIGQASAPRADTADHDADPSTDQYVSIQWAAFFGGWPGGTLPTALADIGFSVLSGTEPGTTTQVRFSSSASPAGYGFLGEPVGIEVGWPCDLDIDGDGEAIALTDGILTVRYEFGTRGDELIAGAVQAGCARCTAAEVEGYLEQCDLAGALDVDADGLVNALTDGILTVRYEFGTRGADLTTGAVGDACTLCTATEIEAFLAALEPRLAGFVARALALEFVAPMAAGDTPTRIIAPEVASLTVAPDETLSFAVSYSTSDANNALTGLGLRLHWDSSKLTFTGRGDLFTTGKIVEETDCTPDVQDYDADPSTDCYVNTAWVDFGGNWPGSALPLTLYSANFIALLDIGERTMVRFSSSSLVPGYGFSATPLSISAVSGADDTMQLQLDAGLNLFAYPSAVMAGHETCAGLVDALGGDGVVRSLARIDADGMQSCDATGGSAFSVQPGQGYVIQLGEPVTLELSTQLACAPVPLNAGQNLAGHPAPPAGFSCFDWLAAAGAGMVDSIRRYAPQAARFETCGFAADGSTPAGVDFAVEMGVGYLIGSPSGGLLPLPGCGD